MRSCGARLRVSIAVVVVAALDDKVALRVGLGPGGPFSAGHAVLRCDVVKGAFCRGGQLQPALAPHTHHVALTYRAASFDPIAAADRAIGLVVVPLPAALR